MFHKLNTYNVDPHVTHMFCLSVPDWSPELLTATVDYHTSVRLEWYVYSPKAQLDQTLKYEMQYYRQPDPFGDMYMGDLVSGPTIVDNLETHSTYSFRLRAYSPSGRGPWSNSLEAVLDGPGECQRHSMNLFCMAHV